MGQQASHPQHPSSPNSPIPSRPPPPSRRPSSTIVRASRKRSLELPEFAALTQILPQAPSQAIPIPMAATVFSQPPSPPHSRAQYFPPQPPVQVQPQRRPAPATTSTTAPIPPAPRRPVQSSHPRPPIVNDDQPVVRSKLPTGLVRPIQFPPPPTEDEPEGTQEATITWRGPAKEVYLSGISDSDRPYRVKMMHEPGSKSTFFTTLRLPPGNHPLTFIVDEQPRCTDTLPTATDTDGALINYIEIPSPSHSPTQTRNGWSESLSSSCAPGSSKWFPEMEWTEQIPTRLFTLAAQEEAYLAARAQAASHPPSNGRAHAPLPPPPPVPYPPSLPRHLEKVILNNYAGRNGGGNTTPAILGSSSTSRPRIIGTGTTGPLIPRGPSQLPSPAPAPSSGAAVELMGGGDDNSVLPVPNHVVLNHLGTSAIKNGVLAVGTTTRYHRKYISTIYYKPI